MRRYLKNRSSIVETENYFLEEADIAVVAYGFTARTSLYVVDGIEKEGEDWDGQAKDPMAFSRRRHERRWDRKGRKIVVPEMNRGQVSGRDQEGLPA